MTVNSSQGLWTRIQQRCQRKASSLFFRRPFLINLDRPIISFTFDDFPRSSLTTGGAVLAHFGVHGTYYASLGLMGQDTATGRIFDSDDLKMLVDQGHELGCHTFGHCNSWETEPAAFEKSVVENRATLHRLMPESSFKTLSYPITVPRPMTKARMASYFPCCRGGGQVPNQGVMDLSQISAYFLEKDRENVQGVKDVIDRNRAVRGWLVFATHDVADRPTPFGCTPEFFAIVVEYAVASGAQIVPVFRALEMMGAIKNWKALATTA